MINFTILIAETVVCYIWRDGKWKLYLLDGEENTHLSKGGAYVMQQIKQQLHNPADLRQIDIVLLFSKTGQNALPDFFKAASSHGFGQVQALALAPLTQRTQVARQTIDAVSDTAWCLECLLPLLDAMLQSRLDLLSDAQREQTYAHEKNIEQLQERLRRLKVENAALQARADALQAAPMEHLVTFLPLFFRNFWEKIRPDELAHLAGKLSFPTIPSPCPDLSPEVIRQLKVKFKTLPGSAQGKIIGMVEQLRNIQKQDIRVEMLDFLEKRNDG
ncbi:hypothetical protein V8J88_12935 [Massilia sp. W12]|uniref:hypothetical protein n=1 Tax=Massilia sp. W12 TaxID=3126507 RepID=UPI0030D4AA19